MTGGAKDCAPSVELGALCQVADLDSTQGDLGALGKRMQATHGPGQSRKKPATDAKGARPACLDVGPSYTSGVTYDSYL